MKSKRKAKKARLTRQECLAAALTAAREQYDARHLWKRGCRVCEAPPLPVGDDAHWSPFCYRCGTHWTKADKEKPR